MPDSFERKYEIPSGEGPFDSNLDVISAEPNRYLWGRTESIFSIF
jgi:hypothetical protein